MSRTTPACVRFEAHLSENPWVLTVDGRREMLAHRPLAGFRQVELNGVLRRYLAVCVPSSRLGSLPLAPSIEVRASGESEAHCLWELNEPVTCTAGGRASPRAFFADVQAELQAAITCDQFPARTLHALVGNPLHLHHEVSSRDLQYSLAQVIGVVRNQPNAKASAGFGARSHFRSGANAEIFDAMRAEAKRLMTPGLDAAQLASQLHDWCRAAQVVQSASMSPAGLERLVQSVAQYVASHRHGSVAPQTRRRVLDASARIAATKDVAVVDAMRHLRRAVAIEANVSVRTVSRVAKS